MGFSFLGAIIHPTLGSIAQPCVMISDVKICHVPQIDAWCFLKVSIYSFVDQNVNIDIWALTPNLHNLAFRIYVVDPLFTGYLEEI